MSNNKSTDLWKNSDQNIIRTSIFSSMLNYIIFCLNSKPINFTNSLSKSLKSSFSKIFSNKCLRSIRYIKDYSGAKLLFFEWLWEWSVWQWEIKIFHRDYSRRCEMTKFGIVNKKIMKNLQINANRFFLKLENSNQ